jgi:signal transduction histidine kinase
MATQLREMETLKADLLADISHDLRSPLSSIAAAAGLLQMGPLGIKEARWLQVIQLDSHKILRLTNQILDLSKLRAGKLQLTLAPAELWRIAEQAADELRPEATEKGVALTVAVPDALPLLACDADRLQQVFANLLSNAIRFTPAGGEVSVTASEADRELILTVADTGIGIPAAQLPQVFDRYQQAHRRRGGTGLGLAIVKEFVEAHGGRVWVESREGEGSQFHVALPQEGPKV